MINDLHGANYDVVIVHNEYFCWDKHDFDFRTEVKVYIFMLCTFYHCSFIGAKYGKCYFIDCTFMFCDGVPNGTGCPRTGAFEAWKVAHDAWTGEIVLIKLLIPETARRRSVVGSEKCKCNQAQVIGMWHADGTKAEKAFSSYNHEFIYEIGDTVVPDEWDDAPSPKTVVEPCGHGIHFFTNPECAIKYAGENFPAASFTSHTHCPYPERYQIQTTDGFGDWSWIERLTNE